MKIYLIGLPGSGKSSLGRRLAKEIGYSFVDLDHEIEKEEGKAIPEIFETKGEPYFRKLEEKVLHDTRDMDRCVIATGGGAPCFFDNMEKIKKYGKSIFIDVSVDELVRRVKNGPQNRPLLNDLDVLQQELDEKRVERLPFYQQADHHVMGDNIQVSDLLPLIDITYFKKNL